MEPNPDPEKDFNPDTVSIFIIFIAAAIILNINLLYNLLQKILIMLIGLFI